MLRCLLFSTFVHFSRMSSATLIAPMPDFAKTLALNSLPSERKMDMCVCCCENMHEVGLGACNHPVACGLCNLRLRVLMNETNCIMCKQAIHPLIITKYKELQFETLIRKCMSTLHLEDIREMDVLIDDDNFSQKMLFLQSFSCSMCKESPTSMTQLQEHVRKAHGMTFCQLCLENRNVFPQEQVRKFGALSPAPAAVSDAGHCVRRCCTGGRRCRRTCAAATELRAATPFAPSAAPGTTMTSPCGRTSAGPARRRAPPK